MRTVLPNLKNVDRSFKMKSSVNLKTFLKSNIKIV